MRVSNSSSPTVLSEKNYAFISALPLVYLQSDVKALRYYAESIESMSNSAEA